MGKGEQWTVETIKEHFNQRLVDQDKAVQAALAAAEKAVSAALVAAERARDAAEANAEKWREQANVWRGSMNDREKNFASRLEMEAEFKALRAELAGLRDIQSQATGGRTLKVDTRANLAIIVAALSSLVALGGLIYTFGRGLMGR